MIASPIKVIKFPDYHMLTKLKSGKLSIFFILTTADSSSKMRDYFVKVYTFLLGISSVMRLEVGAQSSCPSLHGKYYKFNISNDSILCQDVSIRMFAVVVLN